MNSIEQDNDLKILLNIQPFQRLYIDEKGHLQASWFASFVNPKVDDALKICCKNFYTALCEKVQGPFNSEDLTLTPLRQEIRKILKVIKRLHPSIYWKGPVKLLRDFVRFPELAEARLALKQGILPTPVSQGISGTYFLRNRQGAPWVVFKPKDQEPGLPENPKGSVQISSIPPGTGYQRERVAYLLDHEHFSHVPKTVIATLSSAYFNKEAKTNSMKGSVQKFIPSAKEAYATQEPSAQELQRTAILDICTLNTDRHLGNLLIDPKGGVHPIDHGMILPPEADGLSFEWVYLDASKEPFSQTSLDYIKKIDIDKNLALIRKKIPSITDSSLLRVRFATLLLKMGAEKGLSPHQIGHLMVHGTPSHAPHFGSYFEKEIFQPSLKTDSHIRKHLSKILHDFIKNF